MVHGTAAPSSIGQRQQGYAAPIQNSMVYGQAQDRYAHTGASTQNSMDYEAAPAPSGISQPQPRYSHSGAPQNTSIVYGATPAPSGINQPQQGSAYSSAPPQSSIVYGTAPAPSTFQHSYVPSLLSTPTSPNYYMHPLPSTYNQPQPQPASININIFNGVQGPQNTAQPYFPLPYQH